MPIETSTPVRFGSLLRDSDLNREQILNLLDQASRLKDEKRSGTIEPQLVGKNVVVIFEKPSTRTRSAFEVALHDEGAHCTYMDSASSHLGVAESFEDTAKVLGRFYDGIAYRGFEHSSVESLAQHSGIPVWNALTNEWHPTQALADLLTMRETSRKPLEDISVAFVGDASDNVARSLMTSCAIVGMDVRIAAPAPLQIDPASVAQARAFAEASGGRILITEDPEEGVRGADFIYTDVWVSMGESDDSWNNRVPLLRPYRVDADLLRKSGNKDVHFLHCLPSTHDRNTELGRRLFERYGLDGAEVSDEVFRSPASRAYDQAENRMHTIKAVLVTSLTAGVEGPRLS